MDMNRKIELAEQHIRSIATHDDQDVALRGAALDRLLQTVDTERQRMKERLDARIAAALEPPKEQPAKRGRH